MSDELFPGANELEGRTIRNIVGLAMDAPAAANSGHSGTAMALAPLATMMFSRVLRHDPSDPAWPDRDRFILSCGHASILQYGLAHFFGYDLSDADLRAFRQPHSRTPGHPENGVAPTVEVTTGPLGQGIANGVGMAIAERILRDDFGHALVNHRTWVVAGDGCLEEGISHEAASLAGSLGLDKLTVFYDDNHITIDGATELALRDDTPARFAAYGWHVINVGEQANDLDVLEAAARAAIAEDQRPTLIVVRSHIGFPSPTMMDRREAHGSPFSRGAISEAKALLGVLDEPFALDEDLAELNRAAVLASDNLAGAWHERVADAGEPGRSLLVQLASAGRLEDPVSAEPFEGGATVATRKALQRAMDTWAAKTPGLSAGSADLTDNTGVLLTHAQSQSREHPGGRQIYYGIREFAMGAIMVGQALHGGLRPVGSTFFVFSDYVRPAIRLAALSHAGVLFVFTHDSVGVGEDGPTHQPIEHLAALRAMPRLHVVRPSDANETLSLVEDYLRHPSPATTALVLTRQDVAVLSGPDAIASSQGARRGGYVVRESAGAVYTLVATGSEVQHCLSAHETLSARGIATRVVALPCWRCFDEQDVEYRASVLRRDIPSVSLEAGSTLGWHRYVDDALGIDAFGLSAPGSYVFEHFHINAQALVDFVLSKVEASA
ncbi:MAG: transketolase [Actinomycetota bacterium]|jgi:transketolase|nr:transketolase [Actinomycetota bacterium]